ncbi:MAG: succinate dehydrogenase/fumarate reductase iron-sulfur subunit [bacterium]
MTSTEKKIKIKIKRQPTNKPESAYWSTFTLTANPDDRALDLLERIRATEDPTLAFRANCRHGICGSDAMNINGSNRLACRTLLSDLGFPDKIIIQPLPGFTVKKDLVVKEENKKQAAEEHRLQFISDGKRSRQTPKQTQITSQKFSAAISCIECGSCQSACPITWEEEQFPGPQLLTRLSRYIFDARDNAGKERLELINNHNSLWNCQTMYNCVEACPREINITDLISKLKEETIERTSEPD